MIIKLAPEHIPICNQSTQTLQISRESCTDQCSRLKRFQDVKTHFKTNDPRLKLSLFERFRKAIIKNIFLTDRIQVCHLYKKSQVNKFWCMKKKSIGNRCSSLKKFKNLWHFKTWKLTIPHSIFSMTMETLTLTNTSYMDRRK